MKYKNESQRQAIMASVMKKANHMKINGYKAYSVQLRKKVMVKPSDKIEVKKTKLRNGNTSVMLLGRMRIDGKDITAPRIVGQY